MEYSARTIWHRAHPSENQAAAEGESLSAANIALDPSSLAALSPISLSRDTYGFAMELKQHFVQESVRHQQKSNLNAEQNEEENSKMIAPESELDIDQNTNKNR